MAKALPFFKFYCSEWSDGDITLESFETQGMFINICAYYWSNECVLELSKVRKRFKSNIELLNLLIEINLLKVEGEYIKINFLDEQKLERKGQSKVKSKGGLASAEARRLAKIQQNLNTNPTENEHVLNSCSTENQHVLNSCSTEVQVLREEKIREDNNINSTVTAVVYSIAKATEIVLRDLEWIATVETSYSLNAEHFEIALEDFKKHCISIGRNEDRTIYEFKNHFVNWVRIKKQKKQKTVTDKL